MCFLQHLIKFFLKDSMAQPVLYLIQIFQKMLETEIKHKFSMEIYKKSLKGQQRTVLSFNRNFKKNI